MNGLYYVALAAGLIGVAVLAGRTVKLYQQLRRQKRRLASMPRARGGRERR